MKNNLLHASTIVIFGLISCNRKSDVVSEIKKTDSLEIEESKDSLDIVEQIQIDTINEAEFIGFFKHKESTHYDINMYRPTAIDLEISYSFFYNKALLFNDTLRRIVISGYPWSIRNVDNGIKRITTLMDAENFTQIRLYTLDKDYSLIDNATISGYGGDQGTSSWILGEFKNDSTYLMTTYITGFDTDSVEQIINSCLLVHGNGQIETMAECPKKNLQ